MTTKIYEFTGPVKWANKLYKPDTKYATPDRGGVYSIKMNLQGDSLNLYNALGLRSKAARLDDPERSIEKGDVTFKRYEKHPKLGDLGAPEVTGVQEGVTVGNGSTATAKVEVYSFTAPDGSTGFASRLVSVHFDQVIPYEKPATTEGPPV